MSIAELLDGIQAQWDKRYPEIKQRVSSEEGHIGVSWLQRRYSLGYNQARYYLDKLLEDGVLRKHNDRGYQETIVVKHN